MTLYFVLKRLLTVPGVLWAVSKVESLARTRALASEVYSAGKLQ